MGYNAVKRLCDQYRIENYTINIDDSVDVIGDVRLTYQNLKSIPIKFNIVSGNFTISNNQITSLENAPKHVGKDFRAIFNNLVSLEHSPEFVGEVYDVGYNGIEYFTGVPKRVGYLNISSNKLISFSGCPKSTMIEVYNNHREIFDQYYKVKFLFDAGYTPETINTNNNVDLIGLYRQYTLENLIKEE